MKTCFIIKLTSAKIAIADVSFMDNSWWITRINVPEGFRGQGHGTALLDQVLAEADSCYVDLYLWIQPSGGLTRKQLEAWYRSRGFKSRWNGTWVRKARTTRPLGKALVRGLARSARKALKLTRIQG